MVFPQNSNKIEKLNKDPDIKKEGYIWYNSVEKVFKTYMNNSIQLFLMDGDINFNIGDAVHDVLTTKSFSIEFNNVRSINIKHNRNSMNFVHNVIDYETNSTLPTSVEIIDDNEIKIDFVEDVSGLVEIHFS